jgi:tRNA-2-methylthio-N6-dimethylallyladenosine synthase
MPEPADNLSGTQTVYLETMGCQMNVLDSELVIGQLRRMGYRSIEDMKRADLVLLNTCSVRQHAEDKVYSRLGELVRPKEERPDMIVGVIGCMAERDTDGLTHAGVAVDLLCGPGELNQIPGLIAEIQESRIRAVALSRDKTRKTPAVDRGLLYDSVEALDLAREPQPGQSVVQSYIRVQRGCDKFCTFCVVPFTRGPERSRPPQHLVDEAKMLADRGAKEITLLGQTVNSYVNRDAEGKAVSFADLLYRLHEVDGIERIRFVTSYPGDWDDDIFIAMRDLPKVCEYLHIPAQSGSNSVLKRMKRQYTVEGYVELMDRARQIVPNISLAGDFIVGFCGETDEDFAQTVRLVERIQYKSIFVFKYSPRPGTVADKGIEDDVLESVKRQRNNELLKVQQAISLANNQRRIGQTVEVLVEGYSKAALKAQEAEQTRGQEVGWRKSNQLVGRTRGDQIVVFEAGPEYIEQLVPVEITAATALTLHGKPAEGGPAPRPTDRRISLPTLSV